MYTKLPDEDKVFINYIQSMPEEYGDSFLEEDIRTDLYWSISCIRRHSFSFYPVEENSELLLIGDKFGALVGGVCEKVQKVDTVVPTEFHAEALKHRYRNRNNLQIIVEQHDDWQLPQKYPYVFINLDYAYGYNIDDTYEFDRLVNPGIKHLNTEGKLLFSARGDHLWTICRLLFKLGYSYWQYCDPLGNGALFIEASKGDRLSYFELMYPSPLIDDKWVRRHWIPFRGGEIYDQDTELIRQVKEVQIDLLKKLIVVCGEQNLRVYPMYGTLLGIVRDGGMITGDDDIDIALPREDFDILMNLTNQFKGKYFLQTPVNDDCFYGGYAKLRNKETTAIHPQNEWTDACEGISIDIFPIDESYLNSKKEKRKGKKIRFLQRLLYAKSYGYFRQFRDMKLIHWKMYKYFGMLFDRKRLIEKLYGEMKKSDSNGTRHAIYCHYGNGIDNSAKYVDMRAFNKTITLLFEGVSMQVPVGWDRVLRGFYGDEYMNRREFSEGKRRHGFYDVNIPYTVYKKRFGGLKHPEDIHEPVVLFGDGSIFGACMNYYKAKVNIAYLVQLPGEEPMKPIMGVPVYNWEDFNALGLLKTSYRAIICSGNPRMAEKILQKAGYSDYYIFWQNRDWMLYANQTQIWKEIKEL